MRKSVVWFDFSSSSRSLILALFTFLSVFFLVPLSSVVAQQFDMSGDGLSEIALVVIDDSGNLDWQIRSSESGFQVPVSTVTSEFFDLGENGDHLLIGDFFGNSQFQVGFVRERPNQEAVRWSIRLGDGSLSAATFGEPRAVVVGGGDFDQDGTTDIAFVKRNGQAAIRTSPFLDGQGSDRELRLPKRATKKIRGANGEVFFLDGSLGVLYVNQRGKRKSRFKGAYYTFANGEQERLSLKGRARGNIQEVAAIRNNSGQQSLLIHEKLNRKTSRIRIFGLNGRLQYNQRFAGSTVLVGNFTATGSAEQFAVQNGTSLIIVSPFSERGNSVVEIGSGVVADLTNVNKFAGSRSGNSGNGNGSGSGGSGSGASGSLSKVCRSIVGFSTGRLWKPDSDVSDARGGKPVLLLTGGNKAGRSPKRVYDKQGNVVCSGMTFKGSSIPGVNNGADHFYAGWVGGCGLSGGQMASRARQNTGSKEVYVEWKNNSCLKVDDPDERFGGI